MAYTLCAELDGGGPEAEHAAEGGYGDVGGHVDQAAQARRFAVGRV